MARGPRLTPPTSVGFPRRPSRPRRLVRRLLDAPSWLSRDLVADVRELVLDLVDELTRPSISSCPRRSGCGFQGARGGSPGHVASRHAVIVRKPVSGVLRGLTLPAREERRPSAVPRHRSTAGSPSLRLIVASSWCTRCSALVAHARLWHPPRRRRCRAPTSRFFSFFSVFFFFTRAKGRKPRVLRQGIAQLTEGCAGSRSGPAAVLAACDSGRLRSSAPGPRTWGGAL
jgi:hypothetical protein